MKFIISETDEILVSHSGLGLAGALLQGTGIQKRSNAIRLGDRKRPEVSHGDVVTAMIGLLCLGKPDFGAIEAFRQDEFFRRALGLKKVPSEGTLRQRLDELEHRCDAILREESAAMVARHAPTLTPCYEEWVALDIDPAPFDNSGTKKEGVSWTYLKFDGFNPWFAYLGNEGYLVHCQLREGSRHCQDGMPQFLDEAIDLRPADHARRSSWCGWMRATTTWRTSGVARRRRWIGSSSETSARNRWRIGWRRPSATATARSPGRARRSGRARPGKSGRESCTGWCSRSSERTITAEGQKLLVPGDRGGHLLDEPEAARQAGDRALSPARHQRAVSFGDQVGHGLGAIAQRQVRHQRPGVVVGPGGLQHLAVVRADFPPAERPVAHGEADADSQAGGSPSVAERDPGLDVPGGPLDLPLPSPGPVVLAEQSLAWDLGTTLPAVYPPGVPGHTINRKGKPCDSSSGMA